MREKNDSFPQCSTQEHLSDHRCYNSPTERVATLTVSFRIWSSTITTSTQLGVKVPVDFNRNVAKHSQNCNSFRTEVMCKKPLGILFIYFASNFQICSYCQLNNETLLNWIDVKRFQLTLQLTLSRRRNWRHVKMCSFPRLSKLSYPDFVLGQESIL